VEDLSARSAGVLKRIGPISDDNPSLRARQTTPKPVFSLSCRLIARRLKKTQRFYSTFPTGPEVLVAAVDGNRDLERKKGVISFVRVAMP